MPAYILQQIINRCNGYNQVTRIRWLSHFGGLQTLKLYDVLGEEITTLVDEYKPAGSYEVEFDGSGYSSGVYFYSLKFGNFTSVKKLTLLK